MQIFWCSKLLKYYSKKGQIIRIFLLFLVPFIRFLFESLNQTVFFKIRSDIWMLRIVEIFQQNRRDQKTLLIVSCSIYSFLIWVSETNQTVFFQYRLDMSMLKIVEISKKKETDHKTLLIVSCSIYLFLLSPWN